MDTQDIQLLMTLHRTNNITRAAEELYTTQSSVSKRIRQLEKELGIILLLRSRLGIQFTPAGEIVLRHIKAITRELMTMNQELNDAQGVISGTLRIGVSINYAIYRLPPLLRLYQERFPLVHTQLTIEVSQKIFSMFIAGQTELAIVRGEHSDSAENRSASLPAESTGTFRSESCRKSSAKLIPEWSGIQRSGARKTKFPRQKIRSSQITPRPVSKWYGKDSAGASFRKSVSRTLTDASVPCTLQTAVLSYDRRTCSIRNRPLPCRRSTPSSICCVNPQACHIRHRR